MRRPASTLAIATAVPILAGSATGQTPSNFWDNPSGGSWNDASNWSLDRVPDAFDVAIFDIPGPLTVTTIDAVSLVLQIEGSTVELVAPGCGPGLAGLRVSELEIRQAASNGRAGRFRLVDADCGDSVADTLLVFPPAAVQNGLNQLFLSGSTTLRSTNANLAPTACIGFEIDPSSRFAPMLAVQGESYVNAGLRVRPFEGGFPPNGSEVTLIDGRPAPFTERTLFPRFGILEPPPTRDLAIDIVTDREDWDEEMTLKIEAAETEVQAFQIALDLYDSPVVETALGDFDGDTLPDVAAFREDGSWTIYLQNPGGFFVIAAQEQGLEDNLADGTVGDFDADGTLDLAVVSNLPGSEGELRLYFNDGDGSSWTLGPSTTFDGSAVAVSPISPAAAAFQEARRGVAVTTNSAGRGRTESYETTASDIEKTGGIEVGDEPETSDPIRDENKKDPDPPLGVGGDAAALVGEGIFQVLQPIASASGGGFELVRTITLPGTPIDFASGDIDQDGEVETLVITANDALVLLRPLSGTSVRATSLPRGATSISIGDVDVDLPGPEVVIGFEDGVARLYKVTLTPTPGALAGDVGVFLELEDTLDLPDQLGDGVELVGGPVGHLFTTGKLSADSALEIRILDWAPPSGCSQFDLNDDGEVNAGDIGILIASWGPCRGCDADFNDDGRVDGEDAARLFARWGPC